MGRIQLAVWPVLAAMLLTATPSLGQAEPVFQMRSQEWSGTLTGSTSHADCRLETESGRECRIFIDATGLAPNASYSVWLNPDHESVYLLSDNVKPLRTDGKGNLHESSLVTGVPSDRTVEVVVRQDTGHGHWLDALGGTLTRH